MTKIRTQIQPVVGTVRGLMAPEGRAGLDGSVTALHVDDDHIWVLTDRRHLHRFGAHGTELVASLDHADGRCVTRHHGVVWIGGAHAQLWRVNGDRILEVPTFRAAPTSDQWYTPWGGPPDVFSMASDGRHLYVSVHVGGILRTTDGGSWEPTIDLHDDVHQVAVGPDGTVWAATGRRGLAESRDLGATWTYHTDGLHARYALAVAAGDGGPLVAVSSGHAGRDGAVYRLVQGRLERVHGLPDDMHGAIGPRQLAAFGVHAVTALPNGDVYVSDDGGDVWHRALADLPEVSEVALQLM
jgi:hypothetical protein